MVDIKAQTYILCMNQEPISLWAGVGWQRRVEAAEVIFHEKDPNYSERIEQVEIESASNNSGGI